MHYAMGKIAGQFMEFHPFDIVGPIEIQPRRMSDERGYFSETFRANRLLEAIGEHEFVQENESLSHAAGTIRGLHFQTEPFAQGKLVRCLAGAIFDVAVDLRCGSPTFGRWQSVTLSAELGNQLWIPVGFAHGFCTLEPDSVVAYKVTAYYSPEHEGGLAWDDCDIAIGWPDIANLGTLSAKDRVQPRLAQLPELFRMEG